MSAIEIDSVSKRFGAVNAIENVSLRVGTGSCFCLLGHNGAGKTTLIDLMTDVHRPDTGRVRVLGKDPVDEREYLLREVGVMPQGYGVFDGLTARDHLEYSIGATGDAGTPDVLLNRVALDNAIDRDAGTFSRGMKHRLALAMALAGEPDLLILDEPFAGLDPNGITTVRSILLEELAAGTTVFVSSHNIPVVESIATEFGILTHGLLADSGSAKAVCDRSPLETVLTLDCDDPELEFELPSLPSVTGIDRDGASLIVRARKADIESHLESYPCEIRESRMPDISDVVAFYTQDIA